ncbi:hypothetical protein STCU_08523 [Strigomonas culicis]|nr:hypothetical protein STCU_08523 [Strigomonas culicis]|eukprot:EPY21483.1 hypothetical protein STCU_08523 [Strigomonas culicis]
MPKGYNNSVIKAVWSPRICMVQRRTNKYSIDDRKRAENDPFSTTVTYEGPNHLSDECTVSGNVAVHVKKLCGHIVRHFYYTEHKFITRMVLYFKADKQDKLWFLWCGSLRAADRNANSEMPVNLVTNFAEPSGASTFDEDKILWEADEAFLRVTRDEMFFETYMKNVSLQFKSATREDDTERADNVDFHVEAHTDENAARAVSGEKDDFDWTSAPVLVQETHERLVHEHDSVVMLFEDMFYKVKSHFTISKREPFFLDVPRRVVEAITQNGVIDIMRILSLKPKGGAPDGGLRYIIEPNTRTPVTKMLDDSKDWMDRYYNSRYHRLQEAAKMFPHNTPALEAAIEEV